MVKAVFIDIDDTLLSFSDSVRAIMRTGFEEFCLPAYSGEMFDVFKCVNARLWQQIERGELDLAGLQLVRWNTIFDKLGIEADGVAFESYFRHELFSSAIPVPGAIELVRSLSGRYTLCAASNGPYEQQVNRLRLAGLLDHFDQVFVSSRMGAEKPSPAFFDACFDVLKASGLDDLTPQEALVVGDSITSDIAGGAAYGMQTCLYLPQPGPAAPNPAPDHVVTDLRDIGAILDALDGAHAHH